MNIIFKVIVDALLKKSGKEARERELREHAAQTAEVETRRCPVCSAEAGEHDSECPSCGARLN